MHRTRNTTLLFICSFLSPLAVYGADTITVKPTMPSVAISQTVQFAAQVSGVSSTAVTWSAGGAVGGNATAGTISSAGLYTAPAKLPGQNPVQIRSEEHTS